MIFHKNLIKKINIHWQPIYSAQGVPVKFEALLRLFDQRGRQMNTQHYIDRLTYHGEIVGLDRKIFHTGVINILLQAMSNDMLYERIVNTLVYYGCGGKTHEQNDNPELIGFTFNLSPMTLLFNGESPFQVHHLLERNGIEKLLQVSIGRQFYDIALNALMSFNEELPNDVLRKRFKQIRFLAGSKDENGVSVFLRLFSFEVLEHYVYDNHFFISGDSMKRLLHAWRAQIYLHKKSMPDFLLNHISQDEEINKLQKALHLITIFQVIQFVNHGFGVWMDDLSTQDQYSVYRAQKEATVFNGGKVDGEISKELRGLLQRNTQGAQRRIQVILSYLSDLSQDGRYPVVMERIDDKKLITLVQDAGINLFQGYALGKPDERIVLTTISQNPRP